MIRVKTEAALSRHRNKTTVKRRSSSLAGDIYTLISYSYAGKLLFVFIIAAVVIFAAILISKNKFDSFFRITGTAILLITIISWILYLLKRK